MDPEEHRFQEEARQLPDHPLRIAYHEKFSMSQAWFPSEGVTFEEQILSDFGVDIADSDLVDEFSEEIQTITKWLESEEGWADTAAERVLQGANRRARAFQIWEWAGIPVRFKNGAVHRIIPPRDVAGTPIIRTMPAEEYVAGVAQVTAKYQTELQQMKRRARRWQMAAVTLGLALLGVGAYLAGAI